MSEEEGASPPFGFSMDDVTGKIAYAYAKQQVFVFVALFGVLYGAAVLLQEWPHGAGDSYGALLDEIVLILGGLGILVLSLNQKDLKKVNRHAVVVLLLVLLVKVAIIALSVSKVLAIEDTGDLGDDMGTAAVLGLAVLSYPLPTRRGGGPLFSKDAVRQLSNLRTLAFASLLVAVVSLSALAVPSEVSVIGPMHTSMATDDLFLSVIGLGGLVLFLALKNSKKLELWLTTVVAIGLVGALFGLANEVGSEGALGDDLSKVIAMALALLVVFVLSPSLNQGRTIVDRRA